MGYEASPPHVYARFEYPDQVECNLCGTPFTYSREKRTTKHTCRTCMINRHRFKLKAWMVAYKGGGCAICGYNACLRSLDFHHLDDEGKEFHFGGSHNLGWERIKAELDKCVCLCRNCHGEVHEALELREWGRDGGQILEEVERIAAEFEPPEVPQFTRTGWEEYHPKFRSLD